jgi:hypothetical protein
MVMKGVASPTTPGGGTLSRLWSFPPTMTSDDLKSATLYYGDPNVQIWQAAYCMADELVISADASSTDGATMTLSGIGKFPTEVAEPTLPAQIIGEIMAPGLMQLWLDTSSAIGSTEITGRVVSTEWTIPTAVVPKYLAKGPTSDKSFTRTGRGKRAAKAKIVFELLDMVQYDLWAAGTTIKARIRINGPEIESGFYHYAQLDIYGPFDALAWGELEGTNRTIELEIESQYDTTAGHDFQVLVQNASATL